MNQKILHASSRVSSKESDRASLSFPDTFNALWSSGHSNQVSADFSEDEYLKPATHHTQLGWVGGRFLCEVFYGILDSDPTSVFGEKGKGWQPMLGKAGQFTFADLLRFAGFKVSA